MADWKGKDALMDMTFDRDAHFLCVEHPGFVQNADKGIKTLGGMEGIEKVYNNPLTRMPLKFRVDDAYSKPAYADRQVVSNLVLRIVRRRRKSDGLEEYKVVVLGRVDTTYKFQSMCDFQYLPMRRNSDGTYEDIYKKVKIDKLVPLKEYWSQDVPLYVPPMAFSRVDNPVDFQYNKEMTHREGYKNPQKNRAPNLIGTMRQRRSLFTIFVNFGEKIPTGPVTKALDRIKGEYVDHKVGDHLKQIFAEKPLYLKTEIKHLVGDKQHLKIFLPAMCFYWLDGPWRAQWNIFGFDPTSDPSAKLYQTVDFRIRQVHPGQFDIKAKRGIDKSYQWNQITRTQKHNVRISLRALQEDSSQETGQEVSGELHYKFKKDELPPCRLMYYPVSYIELPEVQALLHENDGKETVCNEKDGWCIEDFNNKCRDIMYQYLNKLLSSKDPVQSKRWRTKKKKKVTDQIQIKYDFDDDTTENIDTEHSETVENDDADVGGAEDVEGGEYGNHSDLVDEEVEADERGSEVEVMGEEDGHNYKIEVNEDFEHMEVEDT
ncbi:General transcription factor 3C polypeptide 5 [Mactra antiquata]